MDEPIIDLTREEEQAVLDRVRMGDTQAREELLMRGFASYIEYWASRLHQSYFWVSHRIDFPDLIQEGYLAVLQHLEKALQRADNPMAYLRATVKGRMWDYYRKYASLMCYQTPHGLCRVPVGSLDVALPDDDDLTYADVLVAPGAPDCQPETSYEALYQAVTVLAKDQQEVINRYYGLGDHCKVSLQEIRHRLDGTCMGETSAATSHTKALKKLRTALQSYEQMELTYSMRQAIAVLGVCAETLLQFVKQSRIRRFGRGMYSKTDVDALALERAKLKRAFSLSGASDPLVCFDGDTQDQEVAALC